jgi:hypothetical protein
MPLLLALALLLLGAPAAAQDAAPLRAALIHAALDTAGVAEALRAVPEPTALRGAPPDRVVGARLAAVGGALAAGSLTFHLWQKNAWWADEHRTRFHFHDDGGYALHLDKVGHFHGTYFEALVIGRSFRWTGLTENRAALAGALGALALQTHVEVEDGFNALWGFDVYDMAANVLGAGFFYARERVPALRPLVPKWSYWPARVAAGRDGTLPDQPNSFIDDYAGQHMWLTVRVHDLLPDEARPYWPAWLNVAGGVSGRHLQTDRARREYFLALDVDLPRLFPQETWLGERLVEFGNALHLPAPAIRISPRVTLFGLHYGQ